MIFYWVVICFICRLVESQSTNAPNNDDTDDDIDVDDIFSDFEVYQDLEFLEEGDPILVYDRVKVDRFSFDIVLLNFTGQVIPTLNPTIDSLKQMRTVRIANGDPNNPAVVFLRSQIDQIGTLLTQIKTSLRDIYTYSGTDSELLKPTCHEKCPGLLEEDTLTVYQFEFTQIIKSLPDVLSKEDVENPQSQHYIIMRSGLLNLYDTTTILYSAVSETLQVLHYLVNNAIHDELFKNLHRTECIDSTADMDALEIIDCAYMPNRIQCVVELRTISQKMKFIEMIPISYHGIELDVGHIVKNKTTDELFILDCQHNEPFLSDCKIEKFSGPCENVLNDHDAKFFEIINRCPTKSEEKSHPCRCFR